MAARSATCPGRRPDQRVQDRHGAQRRGPLQHWRRQCGEHGQRRPDGLDRRRLRLEQRHDVRKHEPEHHPGEPAQRCHTGFPEHHGLSHPERDRRGHVAAGVDHPAREPSALQPDHQWHPAGADRLRPFERDLQSDRREDGRHRWRADRLGENRRRSGPGRHAGLWRERRRIRSRSSGEEGRQRWRNLGRWRQGRRLRPEAHSHRQRRDPGGLQPVDQPLGE